MFKNTMITLSVCIVISISIVGFIIYKDIQGDPKVVKDQRPEEAASETVVATPVVNEEEIKETEGLNPFGEKIEPEDMTVIPMEDYIHEMSHQKVIAEPKWGFHEITNERIDWLLDVVSQKDFPNEKIYEGILTRWKKSDFSNIVEDHNSIWRLQGGTIGEATGVLSEEEEKKYIKNNE